MSTAPSEDERHGERDVARGPFAQQGPRGERDEHDLEVGERRRQAAPTSAIAWCQRIRSAAKKLPAIAAWHQWRGGGGPKRRRSRSASRPSTGNA